MESVEHLMVELRKLTPDQLNHIASIAQELSNRNESASGTTDSVAIPQSVVEQAVRNGWPATLFTEVIGKVTDDFKRPAEFPYETRLTL